MKRLTYKLFIFLLIVFHSSFLQATNDFKAYFVDVGQGSCTVIRAKSSPLLLFDSGTCSLRKEPGYKQTQIRYVSEIINKHRPIYVNPADFDKIHINVIISHPDRDHLSWIQEILESAVAPLKIRFLLGGEESKYQSTYPDLLAFIKKQHGTPDEIFAVKYPTIQSINLDFGPATTCRILAALTKDTITKLYGKELDEDECANAQSIVLRIEHGNFSIILAGDADRLTTTDIILRHTLKKTLEELKATVLLASHHGAFHEGCNELAWLQSVRPHYCVLSCGYFSSWRHPRTPVIESILACCPDLEAIGIHKIQSFGEPQYGKIPPPKEIIMDKDGIKYQLFETVAGILSTMNQKNIRISWSASTPSPQNIKIRYSTDEEYTKP